MATICDDSSGYKVLKLFLQSCSDLFFSYLTNRELGVLDRVITDINLRKIYFQRAGLFYSNNKIQSLDELEWILMKGIVISKCHLAFEFEGKHYRYPPFINTHIQPNMCILHYCILRRLLSCVFIQKNSCQMSFSDRDIRLRS